MELLDVSDQLPALMRMPGLQRWRVKVIKLWMATVRASGMTLPPMYHLAGCSCRVLTDQKTVRKRDVKHVIMQDMRHGWLASWQEAQEVSLEPAVPITCRDAKLTDLL